MADRFNLDRIRRSIGSQPSFHGDPTVDALTGMVIALMGEVAVLRDRLNAFERLSQAVGGPGPADVDGFQPEPQAATERSAVRNAMYDRVLGPAVQSMLPESLNLQQVAYEQTIRDVSDAKAPANQHEGDVR